MYIHRDWYKYILDIPLLNTPGENFAYCTGGVNLLGGIIQRANKISVINLLKNTYSVNSR